MIGEHYVALIVVIGFVIVMLIPMRKWWKQQK